MNPQLLHLLLHAALAAGPAVSTPPAEPYKAYVSASADDPSLAAQEVRLDLGGYTFWRLGEPWAARLRAGVAPDGTLVSREHLAGFRGLLAAGDAEAVAERVRWLLGNPMPVLPDTRFPDPAARAKAHPPKLTTLPDGALELRFWVMYPPNTREPFLVRVVAPPQGAATIEELSWDKAP